MNDDSVHHHVAIVIMGQRENAFFFNLSRPVAVGIVTAIIALLVISRAERSLARGGAFIARRGALKVQPSRANPEFPAQPQPEDFFRSHVFEEPLVPVGSQPTTEENAA